MVCGMIQCHTVCGMIQCHTGMIQCYMVCGMIQSHTVCGMIQCHTVCLSYHIRNDTMNGPHCGEHGYFQESFLDVSANDN